MVQLINEFNQDKIKKITAAFKVAADHYTHVLHYGYNFDENWIGAAVSHMDHLRQNKQHLNRMQFIMHNNFPTAQYRKYFMQGEWGRIPYALFLIVVNSFEPSVHMRHIQQQYEEQKTNERQLQQEPVVVQDDENFLVMRAETPAAAIKAKKLIEQQTKQHYSWCISNDKHNLFYRYRTEGDANPSTAYFVWNKTKQTNDAWHAFVLHISKNTIMLSNVQNISPKIFSAQQPSEHLQGIDASQLVVQPLTSSELNLIKAGERETKFKALSYDDKTKHIMQRYKLHMADYVLLDKKQQHLYVHYLNPAKPDTLRQAMRNINYVFMPIDDAWNDGLEMLDKSTEDSVAAMFAANEPYKGCLNYTWSNETKEYYHLIAQRAINNAAELIMKTYI